MEGKTERKMIYLKTRIMECPVNWAVLNLAVDFHSGHLLSAGV
jgi:hypothetical protein